MSLSRTVPAVPRGSRRPSEPIWGGSSVRPLPMRGSPVPSGDGKMLAAYVQRRFHLTLGVYQCQRLFRPWGFRLRKQRPVMAKPTPSGTAPRKKLQALMTDPTVGLWALDEVHLQEHGWPCRMWIPLEVHDAILLHAPARKSIGYFGAVRRRDSTFVSREESIVFDGATCWAFLNQLRHARARETPRVVMILDNASYHLARLHRARRDACAGLSQLFYLPSYSPDFNPCERVSKLSRRLCTHNRYVACLAKVRTAVTTHSLAWAQPNDALRRVCATTLGAVSGSERVKPVGLQTASKS